jgi:hypothetical protein
VPHEWGERDWGYRRFEMGENTETAFVECHRHDDDDLADL